MVIIILGCKTEDSAYLAVVQNDSTNILILERRLMVPANRATRKILEPQAGAKKCYQLHNKERHTLQLHVLFLK